MELSAKNPNKVHSERPFVSIVMPALNEGRYIESAILSLLPSSDDDFDFELLIVDGGSTDDTLNILSRLELLYSTISIIHNEHKTQSYAVNKAARLANPRANIILRADCHSVYPVNFVASCVASLVKNDVASVVVPMKAIGTTGFQRAVAAAQNSRLGNGGSTHRLSGGRSCYVEHGHHAAFDRSIFNELGGYDESFICNEDAEFDRRLVLAGYRIWLATEASIGYFPRSNISSLAAQYMRHGTGRVNTTMKLSAPLKLRQLMPVLIFLTSVISPILAYLNSWMLVPISSYILVCSVWGVVISYRYRSPALVMTGVAAMTMHLAWGFGFLKGLTIAWPSIDCEK